MKTILSCPAKINLFLQIHPKDESGFHPLDTVFVRADQFEDKLHIEKNLEQTGLILSCTNPELPCDETNLVSKAIRKLEEQAGRKLHYKIHIEKNIPLQSGLGGGSSNAAAVLVFINEHEGLGLTHEQLMKIGEELGKDLPFFISGHPVALGTGYGDQIEALPELPEDFTFRIHTGPKSSTKEAFQLWDESEASKESLNEKKESLLKAIKSGNTQEILRNLHNDFDAIASSLGVNLDAASGQVHLSGSGGAVVVFDVLDKRLKGE